MSTTYSPIGVFIASFLVSATAGVAAFLRSGKTATPISLTTAGLNSGLLGLAISLIWYRQFQDNVHFLVGIDIITGLMGAAGLDFVLTILTKGGININLGAGDKNGEKVMEPKIVTEEKKP